MDKLDMSITRPFRPLAVLTTCTALMLSGCQATQPMRTVEYVDLERFMGDWYVIAHIPARAERNAYNALESYRLTDDGSIATTYSFNEGGFDGPEKVMTPRGFVRDTNSNAEWGMQFVWPISAEYLVIYLDQDYSTTIIGRSKRDYVWIMARQPVISDARYRELVQFVYDKGYDTSKLRKVPQETG